MIIREVTVGELPGFIQSGEYRSLSPKPVTEERALSQSRNPRANPGDTALVFAREGDRLLGFAGLLPDFINGNPAWPASSNSGWWTDPGEGGKVAMLLFARALQRANNRLFLTDCSARSKQILEQTGWFHFLSPAKGYTLIFRSYLEKRVSRHTHHPLVLYSARCFDRALNGLLVPLSKVLSGCAGNGTFREREPADEQIRTFIRMHNREEFTARGGTDLDWIMRCPWLTEGPLSASTAYPFSHMSRQFRQYFLVAEEEGQPASAALITVRDNHASLSCFYTEKKHLRKHQSALLKQLLSMQILSLTFYHPDWVDVSGRSGYRGFLRKKRIRYRAVTQDLLPLFHQYPRFQDGDGDVIFTG